MVTTDAPTQRARGRSFGMPNRWSVLTLLCAAFLLGPILAVFYAATGDSEGLWRHLSETVLPGYIANTLVLMAGVGALSLLFGVSSAWVVTRYEFFGRQSLEWLLLLPAAVPAYIIAYTYTDFLEYAGPVQGMLRALFGWHSARDYWFPEIRSMGGAILVMGSVLYPYVYMMARTAFKLTPYSLFEIAQIHDQGLFRQVGLPMARPAIVAGLALVLMETISDFGTVDYFAVQTLTLGIFNVWLGMNNLPAAAQIAAMSFVFVIALLALEYFARSRRRYTDTSRRAVGFAPERAPPPRAAACLFICLTPVVIGFLVPVSVLIHFVLRGYTDTDLAAVTTVAFNSIGISLMVAVIVMALAGFMVFVSTFRASPFLKVMTAVSSTGYAFPGTILAIGVVAFSGALDSGLDTLRDWVLGDATGGFLTGTIGLVLLACTVRFLAVGYGAVTSGVGRLPPNMLNASRVLGRNFPQSLREVVLPLVRSSFLAGGLLVFVDVMKELPMTLLLRPFNFETLATYVYQFAKDELLEQAALPALFVVLSGVGPVILMNAALRRVGQKR
ncbi:MAG: iron ABC transporter permease [Alphaproteobacteria bacterium]